ncbi:MAG: carbohydrate ABC transporter permease [Demequina sp.]|jgi:multiple sugar transport system permease protein|nr:carbohydrate ABC transporter permease [Demequina sp.]
MKTASARSSLLTTGRLLVLCAATLLSVGPLVYMVLVSLAENAYLLRNPLDIFAGALSFENYREVWSEGEIPRYFLNSLVVACVTTALVLLLGSMMAYALARFEFPGRKVIMGLILLQLMVPVIMLLIPQFLLARDLHLLNTRAGLILFYVGGNLAFITFLLVGFFRGIPRELDEAMHLDGAGSIRRYWSLILPLSRPALATGAIFAFLGAWDEYVWAVTIINEPGLRTLPVGIALFSGAHITNWGLTFAASVIALIPVLVVFLIFQRQFVSGITSGALKS